MATNWIGFNENLQNFLNSINAKQQKESEFQEMLKMLRAKAGIEREYASPGEWKPQSMEQALEFERAKAGDPLEKQIQRMYGDYFNQATALNEKNIMSYSEFKNKFVGMFGQGGQAPIQQQPKQLSDWGDVNLLGRLGAALTLSKTPSEQQLGGLGLGGVFKPPIVNRQIPQAQGQPIASQVPQGNRIKVRLKSTGQTGTILLQEFNPAIYERL